MYNYLRELHRQFCPEADCPAQRKELVSLQSELKNHLGQEDWGEALPVAEQASPNRGSAPVGGHASGREPVGTTVSNIGAAGFRTAHSILCELEAQGGYSYEEEETKRICREIGRGKEGANE